MSPAFPTSFVDPENSRRITETDFWNFLEAGKFQKAVSVISLEFSGATNDVLQPPDISFGGAEVQNDEPVEAPKIDPETSPRSDGGPSLLLKALGAKRCARIS